MEETEILEEINQEKIDISIEKDDTKKPEKKEKTKPEKKELTKKEVYQQKEKERLMKLNKAIKDVKFVNVDGKIQRQTILKNGIIKSKLIEVK